MSIKQSTNHYLVFLLVLLLSALAPAVVAQNDDLIELEERLEKSKSDTGKINVRLELFWHYFTKDSQKAKAQLDTVTQILGDESYPKGEADLKRCYGAYYSNVGLYEQAEKYVRESKSISDRIDDTKGSIACLNELAILHAQKGDFEKAHSAYLEVLKKFKEIGSEKDIANAYVNLANVNKYLGQVDVAMKYLDKALELHEKNNNKHGLMLTYGRIASVCFAKQDLECALENSKKVSVLADELDNYEEKAGVEHNLGSYYDKKGLADSALVHWRNAKDLYEKVGKRTDVALIKLNISFGEFRLGNITKSLVIANEAIDLAKEIGDQWTVMTGYDLLTDIYENAQDYENAYKFERLRSNLSDSLRGADIVNRMNELEIAYETSEKENENILLKERDLNNQLEISQLKYQLLGLGAIALAITVFLVFRSRHKKSKAQLIQSELKQKALRSQMNPHFIFNSLNSIQRMYIEGKEEVANDYMADFSRLLRSILENSGKNKISLKEEVELTQRYLDLEQLRTGDLFEYEIEIDDDISVRGTKVAPLILQPYVENAIWHGIIPKDVKGKIKIIVQPKGDRQLTCIISDDGVGYHNSQSKKATSDQTSQGMNITAERLGGSENVLIETLPEGGTRITLTIECK